MYTFKLAFISFTFLFAATASATDKFTFSVAEYPPFTTQTLENQGLLSQIVTEAFALENKKVKFEFYPDARALELAKLGRVDGSVPWAKRSERLEHFYYGEPVFKADDEVFFHKKGKKFHWNPNTQDFKAIENYRIGAIIGFNYGKKFQEAEAKKLIQVIRLKQESQAFNMLNIDRIDLFISPKTVGLYELANNLNSSEREKIGFTLAIQKPPSFDYLIISKKAKRGKEAFEAMNRGLKKLKASGRYKEIRDEFNARLGAF